MFSNALLQSVWGACTLKGPGGYGGVARGAGWRWFSGGLMLLVTSYSVLVFAAIKSVQAIMTGYSYVTSEVLTIYIYVVYACVCTKIWLPE